MPPTLLTDGDVREAAWSPSGAYMLLAVSQTPRTLEQLLQPRLPGTGTNDAGTVLVYDHASRRVRKVWDADDPSQSVIGVTWLARSTTAYLTVQQRVRNNNGGVTDAFGVMAIDAATAKYAWVPGMERLPQDPSIIPSPTKALALAVFDDSPAESEAVGLRAGGAEVVAQQGPPISIFRPGGAWLFPGADNFWVLASGGGVNHRIHTGPAPLAGIEWSADGDKWYFSTQNRKTRVEFIQQLEDDGRLTSVKVPLYVAPPEPKPELWVHAKPLVARQRKAKRGFNSIWLSSPEETWHPDVLVTANGLRADLSPTERAVFYVEGGVAKVRAVELLTEDQKQNLDKAIRSEVLSDVKQAGLALLMYSNDFDDMIPSAGGLDALYPYVKDESILDNFNYTPPGDLNLTRIERPADTQIGYIDGPGGRAIVFSDGHAKWFPNP